MNKGGGIGNFKLTPEQIQEASQLFDTVKIRALADRYNVTVVTLTRAMRREGLLRPKKYVGERANKIRLSPEQIQIALSMYQEKKTLEQMSEKLNIGRKIIARELAATGQYNNHNGRKPEGAAPKKINRVAEREPNWNKDLSTNFLSRSLTI